MCEFERERERRKIVFVMGKERRGSEISLRGMTKEKPRPPSLGRWVKKNWDLIAISFCKEGLLYSRVFARWVLLNRQNQAMLQIPGVFVFNIVARKSFPNGILAVFGEGGKC